VKDYGDVTYTIKPEEQPTVESNHIDNMKNLGNVAACTKEVILFIYFQKRRWQPFSYTLPRPHRLQICGWDVIIDKARADLVLYKLECIYLKYLMVDP
jgi:hypothetical protein